MTLGVIDSKKIINPVVIILAGVTGDLAKRMLLPALYKLEEKNKLHADTIIVGISRREMPDFEKQVLRDMGEYGKLKIEAKIWRRFSKRLFYKSTDVKDSKSFEDLKNFIEKRAKKEISEVNRIFYFSLSPLLFQPLVNALGKSKLVEEKKGWARVVFEKPFGYDLKSARALNKLMSKFFKERQIYRIDHYLGKEMVQNILALRFSNEIFNTVWNNRYIDHVQITAAENFGVGLRAGYYDKSGALKDMVQNHLLQLVTFCAMESPKSLNAEDIRDEKIKLLKRIEIRKDDVVLGQYDKGFIDGKRVVSYREEKDIKKDSKTETFAALKLLIDNNRWRDVPFYVRTGKNMKERNTYVVVVFKKGFLGLFGDEAEEIRENMLIVRLQPYEGISLNFNVKQPGRGFHIAKGEMDFCYACLFGPNTPSAYENLLYDVMIGDSTSFTRMDNVEESWKIIGRITNNGNKLKFPNYESGSWGPKESDQLLKRDGREWIYLKDPIYAAL